MTSYHQIINQIRKEEQIVKELSTCKELQTKSSAKNMAGIDARILQYQLTEQYFDGSVMQAIGCVFDLLINYISPSTEYLKELNPLIRLWLRKLKQIGAPSEEGIVLSTTFKEVEDLLVIKTPRGSGHDEMIHEYFVGVTCLNNLRLLIPNFAYILGGFKCIPPELKYPLGYEEDDNEVVMSAFCENKLVSNVSHNLVNYVIYEKIAGISLREFCRTSDDEVALLSYFIQIFSALHIAWVHCDFTHYDLHDENVILREIDEPVWIHYDLDDDLSFFVNSNSIATIIDYGISHVKYQDEHFGTYLMEQHGVYATVSNIAYDIYKLLGFCMYRTKFYNESLYNKVKWLWDFFPDKYDPYKGDLERGRAEFFVLPLDSRYRHANALQFIRWIRTYHTSKWNQVVSETKPDSDKLISCNLNPSICNIQNYNELGERLLEAGNQVPEFSQYLYDAIEELLNTRIVVTNSYLSSLALFNKFAVDAAQLYRLTQSISKEVKLDFPVDEVLKSIEQDVNMRSQMIQNTEEEIVTNDKVYFNQYMELGFSVEDATIINFIQPTSSMDIQSVISDIKTQLPDYLKLKKIIDQIGAFDKSLRLIRTLKHEGILIGENTSYYDSYLNLYDTIINMPKYKELKNTVNRIKILWTDYINKQSRRDDISYQTSIELRKLAFQI